MITTLILILTVILVSAVLAGWARYTRNYQAGTKGLVTEYERYYTARDNPNYRRIARRW